MKNFLYFMESTVSAKNYSIRIDPSTTSRQLVINRLKEMDEHLVIGNKLKNSIIWVKTSIPKKEIEALLGINYVNDEKEIF